MKKVKLLFILLLILFLTGCEATYHVNITDEEITESLVLDGALDKEAMMQKYQDTYQSLIGYQNKEKEKDFTITRSYKTPYYGISPILESVSCVFFSQYDDSNDIALVTIDTLNVFEKYPELDKLTIQVKTPNVVFENNADRIKKDTYIWELDRNNYIDKTIAIRIRYGELANYDVDITKYVYIAFSAILGIGLLIFLYYILIYRKKDEI